MVIRSGLIKSTQHPAPHRLFRAFAAPFARQVKEELGKFQGEVCGQLQD